MVNDVDGAKREMTMMLFVFQLLSECFQRGEKESEERTPNGRRSQRSQKDFCGLLFLLCSRFLFIFARNLMG